MPSMSALTAESLWMSQCTPGPESTPKVFAPQKTPMQLDSRAAKLGSQAFGKVAKDHIAEYGRRSSKRMFWGRCGGFGGRVGRRDGVQLREAWPPDDLR